MWELDYKESWGLKNWCFLTVVLEKTLESPLDCKEIQPVHPKGNESWIFIWRTDAEAEAPILWSPEVKSWLIWKYPDVGKEWGQEEKGMTEDEMVGWHHWLNEYESEQTPGDGEGQGAWRAAVHAVAKSRTQHLNNNSWVWNVFVLVSTLPKWCSEVFNFQLLFMSPPSAKLMTLESLLINIKELLYQSQNISYGLHTPKRSILKPTDLGFGDINAVMEIIPFPKVFIYSLWLFCACVSPSPQTRWLVT